MKRLSRAPAFVLAVGALGSAPVQCKRSPDPNLRLEDSAGDALWDLATEFDRKGNPAAAEETLRRLVERYPSNRHAPAAKERLEANVANASDGGS